MVYFAIISDAAPRHSRHDIMPPEHLIPPRQPYASFRYFIKYADATHDAHFVYILYNKPLYKICRQNDISDFAVALGLCNVGELLSK